METKQLPYFASFPSGTDCNTVSQWAAIEWVSDSRFDDEDWGFLTCWRQIYPIKVTDTTDQIKRTLKPGIETRKSKKNATRFQNRQNLALDVKFNPRFVQAVIS